MTARSVTNRILLAVSLLSLVAGATTAHASSAETDNASPPAAQIVYSAAMKKDYEYKLYLANWPNPKPRELNPKVIGKYGLGETILYPVFSPDGTKVLFLANRKLPNGKLVETDGYLGTDIWVLDVRANTVKPLTTDGHGYDQHQWSPDGRYVCAVSHEGCPPPEPPADVAGMQKKNLYVWDTVTGKRRFIAPNVDSVLWSRDSRSLYYSGVTSDELPALLRKSRNGGRPAVILTGNRSAHLLSPDNQRYVSWEYDSRAKQRKLYMWRIGTGERKVLLAGKRAVGPPEWLPDSRRIALWLQSDGSGPEDTALTILDTTTAQMSAVPHATGVFRWSRRMDWIIAQRWAKTQAPDASEAYLVAVSVKSGKVVTLIHPPQASNFDWYELPAR